ncbi:hypothetical protein [Alloactinosynnema sp. L-07]|uniref:hypothetical protein n=1 Tax=Alloactinosynnema sp. L-07 TaxID=1653480 RepID=UPI00065EFE7C|nr:hypothetical protein [Alloactinosynnema sp. L-07]CRK59089.1 hypothetical protein [Alloactinosynnema sp. L-07]
MGAPIEDLDRPRPVRITAFAGLLAQALLVVAALIWALSPALVAAIVGVIAVAQTGGWLWVEKQVTPISEPRNDDGVLLVPLNPRSAREV